MEIPLYVHHGELVKAIDFTSTPRLVLAISTCRSGSTALARIFDMSSDVTCVTQPIKNALRYRMMGEEWSWHIPDTSPIVFAKETFGPIYEQECNFNPVRVLLDSGYPAEKITVVVLARNPNHTWGSLKKWWTTSKIEHFIMAYHNLIRCAEFAQANKIQVINYVSDLLNDYEPNVLVKALFQQLQIPFSNHLTQWKNKTFQAINIEESKAFLSQENYNPTGDINNILRDVENADCYKGIQSSYHIASKEALIFKQAKIYEIYNEIVSRCLHDLKLSE